jgi:hypothetical protein
MLIIIATILSLTTLTGTLSPDACLISLGVFRILLGIGVPCQLLSPLTTRTSANEVPCFRTYSPTKDGEVLLAVWPRLLFCCVAIVLWKGEEKSKVDGGA